MAGKQRSLFQFVGCWITGGSADVTDCHIRWLDPVPFYGVLPETGVAAPGENLDFYDPAR